MAFAAPKKSENEPTLLSENILKSRNYEKLSLEERTLAFEEQVERLETDQKRINSLLSLSSYLPSISKVDLEIEEYERKMKISSENVESLEKKIKELHGKANGSLSSQNCVSIEELGLKPSVKRINFLSKKFSDLENMFESVKRTAANNFKVEKENLAREMEFQLASKEELKGGHEKDVKRSFEEHLRTRIRSEIEKRVSCVNESVFTSLNTIMNVSKIIQELGQMRLEIDTWLVSSKKPTQDHLLDFLRFFEVYMEQQVSGLQGRVHERKNGNHFQTEEMEMLRERVRDLLESVNGMKRKFAFGIEKEEEREGKKAFGNNFVAQVAVCISRNERNLNEIENSLLTLETA